MGNRLAAKVVVTSLAGTLRSLASIVMMDAPMRLFCYHKRYLH